MKKKIFTGFILLLTILSVCSSCKKKNTPTTTTESTQPESTVVESNDITVSDTSFKGYDFSQVDSANTSVTYNLLQMQNSYMQELGIYGDGCQWEVALESSKSGDLMLYGLDVAGMFRSLDHGKTWEMCNTGFLNRGAGMFAIDPHNESHVLALGIGQVFGMHVSTDMAKSFTFCPNGRFSVSGHRYFWDGLEFDPTTYDEKTGETQDVYFSMPYNRDRGNRLNSYTLPGSNSNLTSDKAGLYKSTDGGRSYTQISNNEKLSDGIIKFTDSGKMFIGNQHGLFNVDSNGNIIASWLINEFTDYNEVETFDDVRILKYNLGITGLDVVGDTIYAQTQDGIYILNSNSVLTKIESTNYPTYKMAQFLEVSSSNPSHMILQARNNLTSADSVWSTYVYNSKDGGKTWTRSLTDADSYFTKGSWNGREKLFIIDPSNDKRVVSFASDTLAYSDDYGDNFLQVNGISNMMVGGKIHMNYYNPNLLFYGAQDYSSVLSKDGGKTFERIFINANDGSSTTFYWNLYGGFAADELTFYGFADTDWYGAHNLVVTHDGGKTWTDTGLKNNTNVQNYALSSMQSFNNPNVLFAGQYYSKDHGYTWNEMNGCVQVYEMNYTGKNEIYGVNSNGNIVVSYDDGDTFSVIYDKQLNSSSGRVSETFVDLAYDHVNNYIYALHQLTFANNGSTAIRNSIYKIDLNTNKETLLTPVEDPNGWDLIRSVDIDPNSVNTIYICQCGSSFSCSSSLQRSIDGGATFSVLTSSHVENMSTNQGGYEVSAMAVNYMTGELIYGSGCYGFGVVNAPYDSTKLSHTSPTHTVKYVYNGEIVKTDALENNQSVDLSEYDVDGYTFVNWCYDKELSKDVKDLFAQNSYVLYAKMEDSQKISFNVDGNIVSTLDLDSGFDISKYPVPTKEGYTFAGWYTNLESKTVFDYKNYTENVTVYAGFLKTGENIYDNTSKDYEAYIRYSDERFNTITQIEEGATASNRSIQITVKKNTYYLVTMKMSNRFRVALDKNFWPYNRADYVYIDSDDTNTSDVLNKDIRFIVSSEEYTKMMIYYYTETEGVNYLDIKNSIQIYEIQDNNLIG